ncbi:nuclear transport factor 2 family protein [Rouxiella chamberiensis]|uniref:Nuclear transport factor 2 family protein n=1 Tax=Rouxiella chamberiensis TaxID=1513468 RepID=A0ABY7HRV3_9GAMM|nr:nuclear transport factor 2 family protein [Rouxiella chamberiensis]WAT01943.1 nuclear transport factor 2 family protein [Rouxiella chamberiensis]
MTTENRYDPIQQYIDESRIQRLLSLYAHNLDDGKFTENALLFEHADFIVINDFAHGSQEVKQFFENGVQRHEDGTPRTWHSVSNVLIELSATGETARSVCYFTVHQALDAFPLQPICAGRYEDSFEKYQGEWRFTSRKVVPRLMGDVHLHVGQPLDSH